MWSISLKAHALPVATAEVGQQRKTSPGPSLLRLSKCQCVSPPLPAVSSVLLTFDYRPWTLESTHLSCLTSSLQSTCGHYHLRHNSEGERHGYLKLKGISIKLSQALSV